MRAMVAKRLAILLVVLSLLAGSVFAAQQYQVNRLAKKELKNADSATQKGDFARAETLYRQLLQHFPDDQELQIKYANVLLKISQSPDAQAAAAAIYSGVLARPRSGAREDVRRLLVKLKFDMGQLLSTAGQMNGADVELKILLDMPANKNDGHLLYLRGRCSEEKGDDPGAVQEAVEYYQKAIDCDAPERINAAERKARLLCDKLNQPTEAKSVIDAIVKDAPSDYRVYLARGRFLLESTASDKSGMFNKADVKNDFEKARKVAPHEPEVYLQLAQLALREEKSGYEQAREILKDGLKNAPDSVELYNFLASIEFRAGKTDKAAALDRAIAVLEAGLKRRPDQGDLRVHLTDLLVERGDTGKLDFQIEELKKLGHPQPLIRYFAACSCINKRKFLKARQILLALQAAMNRTANVRFKSRINVLLAQCYKELGEPEMEENAYLLAYSANHDDLKARLGWITTLVNQGDTLGAIKEYRAVVKQVPKVRPLLTRLLIAQNQRRPEPQRDWKEVKSLIEQMILAEPESVEAIILKAELFVAQGDQAAAQRELEKAQVRFPKSIEIIVARANLIGFQGRSSEALSLLDQAQQEVGDQVDLRLERAKLWASKKGPEFLKVLMDLSENVDGFSAADQKRLLNGLAVELVRQQDLEGASRVWTKLAAKDPANIELRLNLVDLALQNANKDDIEKNIRQIEEIEGKEGLQGRYCQVRYLIWQAKRAGDKDTRLAIQLKARRLLDDLVSRRGDWSLIPLAAAELAEQELEGDLKGDELRAKEQSIIGFYLQAIKLGQRRPAVLRRTVQLLFQNGQGGSALELLGNMPIGGDVGRHATRFALETRDFEHAIQLARKAVEAKPDDFQEVFWLVQVLLASDREAEAKEELRRAVDLSPKDPDRWIALVNLMISAKKPVEAEKFIQEAQTKISPPRVPITMAHCCEMMGRNYDGSGNDPEMKRWNGAAKSWYEKAEAAEPNDLSIKRSLTEFLLRSRQSEEAQQYLARIGTQGGAAQNAETSAWARRTLALLLASGNNRTQSSKALSLFEPDGKPVPAGREGKKITDPDDRRVLARVLELQRTPPYLKRAIEILEGLVEENTATSDDRFLLARVYEAIGDWPTARQKYRELNLRTRTIRDIETLNRRPYYLAQFTSGLLQHHKPGDTEDLAEAQELVDEIKQLQPAAIGTLILQVEIHRICNQIDQAVQLIQAFAAPPSLTPQTVATLANMAEKLKQFQLAEQLYRRQAQLPGPVRSKLELAMFLSRRNLIKESLSVCEPLWKNPRDVQLVAITCINILFGSEGHARTPEPAQIDRVAGWLEQAITQAKDQRRPSSLAASSASVTCVSSKAFIRKQKTCISKPSKKVIGTESL